MNSPTVSVTWYKAVEFCQKLSEKIGKEYRLPSEAEWEYACRAGTTTEYNFGEISQQESFEIGIGILKLVVESEEKAGELARNLIEITKQEVKNSASQQQLRELIETIIIYKFPKLSYEEIENMLNLQEIKQTRVYQEAKKEGIKQGKLEGIEEGMLRQKLAMIPLLQELGLTIEQIAQRLEISENSVRESIK